MFDKIKTLFGSTPPPPPAGPQIAMPLFTTAAPVAPGSVVEHWSALFPNREPLRIAGAHDGGPVTQFEVEGRTLMTVQMPMAIPSPEALAAVETSWMWKGPDDAVRHHLSHAVVTAPETDQSVEYAWAVTLLSAAMLKAGAGAALYWGNARQVHTVDVVETFAREGSLPPVALWVGITISGESGEGPFSAATHGLEAFGHKELEVLETRRSIGDLRTTLLDMALYVLQQGPVLLHGQTCGPDANARWGIEHTRSKLVPGRNVIRLAMP